MLAGPQVEALQHLFQVPFVSGSKDRIDRKGGDMRAGVLATILHR